jgi:CHASE3 domain sensor protein
VRSSATRSFRGTPTAALVAFALVVVVAFAVDRSTALLSDETETVRRTYEVISRLDLLEDALGDAENARRGYALTGDAAYVQAFDDARTRAERLRGEVRTRTKDNESHQRRLDRVERLLTERMAALDAAIKARGATLDAEREARVTNASAP